MMHSPFRCDGDTTELQLLSLQFLSLVNSLRSGRGRVYLLSSYEMHRKLTVIVQCNKYRPNIGLWRTFQSDVRIYCCSCRTGSNPPSSCRMKLPIAVNADNITTLFGAFGDWEIFHNSITWDFLLIPPYRFAVIPTNQGNCPLLPQMFFFPPNWDSSSCTRLFF